MANYYDVILKIAAVILCMLCLAACHEEKILNTRNWDEANRQIDKQFGAGAMARLKPHFEQQGIKYPPKRVSILAFKHEQLVELWAQDKSRWVKIKEYPMTATSGEPGPKLKEFDRQIPEGVYDIQFLFPFSQWHLSMRLNYPNQHDRHFAKLDGRKRLGGDIYIHGHDKSAGCLAIGNRAIEELYLLVRKIGVKNTKVIIASNDIRKSEPINVRYRPLKWLPKLNQHLHAALKPFKEKRTA